MAIKRIIPFSEGRGDVKAIPVLMRRVLENSSTRAFNNNDLLIGDAWRVGHLQKLAKSDGLEWGRQLNSARAQGASGVLLLLDGDKLTDPGSPAKCPAGAAKALAEIAKTKGFGNGFSVAVVFAMQEMESWFIAGAVSLANNSLDIRLNSSAVIPTGDLEKAPRDAKGWLSENMPHGYKPSITQTQFARAVDFHQIRSRKLRSFQRFEKAVVEICSAVISGRHIITP